MKTITKEMNVLDLGGQLSDKKLAERVLNKKEPTDRLQYFKTLLQRRSAASKKTALKVVDSPFYNKRMKLTAISYLSQFKGEAIVKCLRKTLTMELDAGVKRKAMRSLGVLGDVSALKELTRETGKEASVARSLISYQNGLSLYQLPKVATKAFTKRLKHAAVELSVMGTKEKKAWAGTLEDAKLSKQFYTQALQKVQCGSNAFVLAAKEGKEQLLAKGKISKPAIPLQVLTTHDCPNKASLMYRVLLHPMPKSDTVHINLVNGRGDIHYTGEMKQKGGSWEFSLATAKKAILPAIKATGSYNAADNKLEFKEFFSATQLLRELRKTPKPVGIKR